MKCSKWSCNGTMINIGREGKYTRYKCNYCKVIKLVDDSDDDDKDNDNNNNNNSGGFLGSMFKW